ncbi:unnamed protein product [Bursaphelenchus xylophilus]|uniref:(pine wood nematode) hypothetical protein n=1 Tax=Bursaphelenchus xylophilus TaxID=6326 RepID=A0A1I7RNX0_BURXY|nr:unnamed protein product [Bursaphelenchus xylophilus]CAG9124354.1 unnamed protein product [Bursaphelenchus xylophilus]
MARITEANGRGSPSEVFSTNILQMENGKKPKKPSQRFKNLAILAAILCVLFMIATVALAIMLGMKMKQFKTLDDESPSVSPIEKPCSSDKLDWPEPSGSLGAQYKKAAIATDHGFCSEIGRNILIKGGNAVDSAIASLLCIGVVNPQSSGIGGGFIMTVYNTTTQRCFTIDARETAPKAATEDMFVNQDPHGGNGSIIGFRSIATPGEIHGYRTAFLRYGSGKVTWKEIFEPAINLARNGFPVSSNLAMVLVKMEQYIRDDEDMRRAFFDPATNKPYEEGQIMKRVRLAETLDELANSKDPIKLFYKGGMAQTISSEITENGGLVTPQDLESYETTIYETPLESNVLPGDLIMCGPPPPSSFAVAAAIVGVMAEFYRDKKPDLDDPLVYHRLIEAEKFAYAQRTHFGDSHFVKTDLVYNMTTPEFAKWVAGMIKEEAQPMEYYSRNLTGHVPDHGTSHVTSLDPQGNAASVTSTVNQLLGAVRISQSLGIVWNDQMDDFSTPGVANGFGFAPSPANFIQPGKKPMSSMSPVIIYDSKEGRVKMVVGASGGSRIISAVAQTIIRSVLFGQTVKEAVDAPRIHHQFIPFNVEFETTLPEKIVSSLANDYKQTMTGNTTKQHSVVQALIHDADGFIHGNSDFRRKTATYPAGF